MWENLFIFFFFNVYLFIFFFLHALDQFLWAESIKVNGPITQCRRYCRIYMIQWNEVILTGLLHLHKYSLLIMIVLKKNTHLKLNTLKHNFNGTHCLTVIHSIQSQFLFWKLNPNCVQYHVQATKKQGKSYFKWK